MAFCIDTKSVLILFIHAECHSLNLKCWFGRIVSNNSIMIWDFLSFIRFIFFLNKLNNPFEFENKQLLFSNLIWVRLPRQSQLMSHLTSLFGYYKIQNYLVYPTISPHSNWLWVSLDSKFSVISNHLRAQKLFSLCLFWSKTNTNESVDILTKVEQNDICIVGCCELKCVYFVIAHIWFGV